MSPGSRPTSTARRSTGARQRGSQARISRATAGSGGSPSRSVRGQGDFSLIEGEDTGEVENSLTALYPYAKVGINDKVDVWGLVGFGSGELTLIQHADSQRMKEQQYTTDIAMRMGALGVRGQVLTPEDAGAMSLAVKSDAFWIRMDSDAVENDDGRLAASQADANRVRIIVEGSRAFETGTGTLTPSAEIGLRHDGGDAETGAGIEAGAGLRFEGAGFSIEGAVRSLVAHEASGYEEWGASGAIRIAPGDSGRGLSFTLAPTFGTTGSRIDQLWSAQDTGRLGEGKFEAGQRLEAELGYGIAVPRTRGLLTPYAGLSLAEGRRAHVAHGTAVEGRTGSDARGRSDPRGRASR